MKMIVSAAKRFLYGDLLSNYLHYKHIKFALENKIIVICEKPLVLNLNELILIEKISKKQKTGDFLYFTT